MDDSTFNVPQWIKNGIKIREASCFMITTAPHSPDISPCGFWLFEMLKEVLKDREFKLSHEIEDAITKVWDELIFDEVQSLFHNWMSGLASVIGNGGEYTSEEIRDGFLACRESQNRRGAKLSLHLGLSFSFSAKTK
jgi:hypothetical protein